MLPLDQNISDETTTFKLEIVEETTSKLLGFLEETLIVNFLTLKHFQRRRL